MKATTSGATTPTMGTMDRKVPKQFDNGEIREFTKMLRGEPLIAAVADHF
jgi:hypothetical protein